MPVRGPPALRIELTFVLFGRLCSPYNSRFVSAANNWRYSSEECEVRVSEKPYGRLRGRGWILSVRLRLRIW